MNWDNLTLKEKLADNSSKLFLFFIFFYGVQLIVTIFNSNMAPPWDLGASVSIISIFFIIHLKRKFTWIAPLFLGIGFLPHIFGLYKFFDGENTLYGLALFNFHYDWIVHGFGTFCYSITFASMTYPYFKKGFKSKLLIFVILLFFMTGLGAFNETLEYVGYDVLGFGEGFLEFGAGDGLHVGGPWENASLDMLLNLFGALTGIILFLLIKTITEDT